MIHQLRLVGGNHFLAAVLALHRPTESISTVSTTYCPRDAKPQGKRATENGDNHTIEVGLGALTGRPLAFTGARVPAFSAALCSRWIYTEPGKRYILCLEKLPSAGPPTLAFLEIGMVAVLWDVFVDRMSTIEERVVFGRRFSKITLVFVMAPIGENGASTSATSPR